MKLEHVAIYTKRLEVLREFYEKYFDAKPNEKYTSKKEPNVVFESYFLSFESGARLELMTRTDVPQAENPNGVETAGLTHIALSVGCADDLDRLFMRLKGDGVSVVSEPRTTGDGYYEACVLDPDGNRIEITG